MYNIFYFIAFAKAEAEVKFDWIGFVVVLIFYVIILIAGVGAARMHKNEGAEEMVLAGRSLSGFVGVLTMVSTWVCGGYLYGTTQGIMTEGTGLAWTQAPWCYAVCFFFGALLFVKKMRESNYITMMDPLQKKFGNFMTGLYYIPTILGDIFWIGMALATLGAALSAIIGVDSKVAVIVSAALSAFYTFAGGLYAVAFTDVIQLTMMLVCLYLAIPFVLTSDRVSNPSSMSSVWLGSIAGEDAWVWIDYALLMCLGGVPWQVYFQRVLACKTVKDAQVLSIWSGIGAFVSAVPAAIVGIWGTTVDWSQTPIESLAGRESYALSYILKYCTPKTISYLALGGISAATMSTSDSALLASSTVFVYNIYKPIFRRNASDREMVWATRVGVIVVCVVGVILAIVADDVYSLWVLTSDFIYVLLFPQLLLALYYNRMNVYGSFVGFIVGAFLRFGGGEATIGIPALIDYGTLPFRSIAMISCLILIVLVTEITRYLIVTKGYENLDFVHYYKNHHDTELEEGNVFKTEKEIELQKVKDNKTVAKPDSKIEPTVENVKESEPVSPEPVDVNTVEKEEQPVVDPVSN